MGYELELRIVDVSRQEDEDGTRWGDEIARMDLSKLGYTDLIGALHDKYKPEKPNVFVYADDGDTKITHDRYDEPMSVMDPRMVRDALVEDQKSLIEDGGWGPRGYVMYDAAIAFLDTLLSHDCYRDLKVLGYGH